MNIYQELVKIIEGRNLKIKYEKIYDGSSGWTGKHRWVIDPDNDTVITDLTASGFHFNENELKRAKAKIESYFVRKEMNSLEEFGKWLDEIAE